MSMAFLCKPLDALRLKKTFERFERSRAKCHTEQALCAHDRRYRLALEAQQQYDLLIGEKQP